MLAGSSGEFRVMGRKVVAVLMGGVSSEHDVSINSGRMVAANLDPDKYDVIPVVITLDGAWAFGDEEPVSIFDAVHELKARCVDCVFIALHGPFGEDGRIQGMLDLLGLPYTSSGCDASAIAMDKIRSKAVVRALDIRVPRHMVIEQATWRADPELVASQAEEQLGFSCVIKSPCQGSSLGMAISPTAAEFPADMDKVFEYGNVVMIEEYIPGIELTCGVLDVEPGGMPQALPVTQIMPVTSSFFDYEAKYTPGATEEITPADITRELTARVQEIAVRAHRVIGCSIWSRSDFLVAGHEDPVWIEVNTVPGMTKTSLYPQAAAAAGISYAELVGLFVEGAIARKALQNHRL
ncbi:MAG TPA: D-alanine--D-alanine ligase [Candidatus Hydrogenedentes bacterium]|nr:D-alanine--D-alanine ligase [Candidatus Hydrogenedentota bacterium]